MYGMGCFLKNWVQLCPTHLSNYWSQQKEKHASFQREHLARFGFAASLDNEEGSLDNTNNKLLGTILAPGFISCTPRKPADFIQSVEAWRNMDSEVCRWGQDQGCIITDMFYKKSLQCDKSKYWLQGFISWAFHRKLQSDLSWYWFFSCFLSNYFQLFLADCLALN